MVAVPSVRICSERIGSGEGTGEVVRRVSGAWETRGPTHPIVLPCGGCRGRGAGTGTVGSVVRSLWTTGSALGGQGFDYLWVSTASRGCPQVVHRFIHRMAVPCVFCEVIHNAQVMACVRKLSTASGGLWVAREESYPQVEVIHSPHPLWNSHALWTTVCAQGAG